jgi:hypothetical protein
MSAEVHSIMRPDTSAMHAHLDHLFGGYLEGFHDGLIELAWTEPQPDASGRYKLKHAQLFGTDQLDELVAKAVEVNSLPRTNVYIGAALRKPDANRHARSNDGDFYAATVAWSDLDDADANAQAKHRFAGGKPTMVVRTGSEPHGRHQLWWRLVEPVTDPERLSAMVKGIAVALSGDGSVSNPSRVMRLAGTIAWDQKPGRVPEVTAIHPLREPGPNTYVAEHLEHVYKPLYDLSGARERRERNERGPDLGIVRGKNGLGLEIGKVVDGREKFMRNLLCARLIDFIGRFGAAPSAEELFDDAWPKYESEADLTRPGRGRHEFMDKCRYTVARFLRGEIPGVRTLDDAARIYNEKKDARQNSARHQTINDEPSERPDDVFEFLTIPGIKALPDPVWVVEGMIPEDGLGFVYGPPGHGKSFVCLDLALSVAYAKLTWWDEKPIKRPGLVIYIAREGQAGLKSRIEAWQRHHGAEGDDAPFALIRSAINFMDQEDIGRLVRTVAYAAKELGAEPSLVFVDTVSRVLPGADENGQKEMTLFVAACDAVRDAFKATVVGVHHAGKSGDMRGSTVLKGAGDFVYRVQKIDDEDEARGIEFACEKQKDAEDGWRKVIDLKPVEWVEEGKIEGERKSLVPVVRGQQDEPKEQSFWPSRDDCKKGLDEIRRAWVSGSPWAMSARSKTEGRYAPRRLSQSLGVPADAAEKMLLAWLENDILAVEMVDTKSKRMGLKVVRGLD